MSAPLVSIIIPCHNAARWVGDALQSALGQTWPHLDVIVVDDGSDDASAAIVGRLADRRTRLVQQANRGASAARNHGLRLARGDYVQYLDADDLLSPDKVEAQVRTLQAAPADTVATCCWGRFDRDPTAARFVDQQVFRDFEPVEYLTTILRTHSMMHPSAWLVPRPVADRAGPWDETLSLNDDGEYFARVVLASSGIRFSTTGASYYRSGVAGSLSGRRDELAVDSQFRSLVLIEQRLVGRGREHGVRAALADAWQRFLYEYYPAARRFERAVAGRIRAHGGSRLNPPWGPRGLLLARLVGWRATARLREGWTRRRRSWRPSP